MTEIGSSLTTTFGAIASWRARCSSAILVGEYVSFFLPAFARRDRPDVGITSSSSSSSFLPPLFLLPPRPEEGGASGSSLSKSDHFSSSCISSSSESSSSNSISSTSSSSSSDSSTRAGRTILSFSHSGNVFPQSPRPNFSKTSTGSAPTCFSR